MSDIPPDIKRLRDTGFGPLPECGDEPVRKEWRLWVILALLCALHVFLVRWAYLSIWG